MNDKKHAQTAQIVIFLELLIAYMGYMDIIVSPNSLIGDLHLYLKRNLNFDFTRI